MPAASRIALAAVALGAGTTWNMSSVGAIADPTAAAYDVSLVVVGTFTGALVLTHFLAQLPAGRAADRRGALGVGLLAAGLCAAGNAIGLLAPEPELALFARAVTGLGSGAGFVAGSDAMRAAGLSLAWQGGYGASTMLGGGLAVAAVPLLEPALGWRAPYWSGLAIAVALAAVLAATPRPPVVGGRGGIVLDRRLVPLGIVHAASFGLTYVAANWIVPLLDRHGAARTAAALAGALVLLGGIATRIGGGVLSVRFPDRRQLIVLAGLSLSALGGALLALPLPFAVLVVATLLAGLGGGLPFAVLFGAAQRLRPDAPAGAIAFVNAFAILVLLVGTPLVGAAFSLPGDGRIAFAVLALLALAAMAAARRAPL